MQFEAFLDDGDQHIDRDGDPDLGFDGVLAGAEEAFDAQVLLDPLEEQLDLPAAFVELGDGQRRQREVVGQEDQGLGRHGVAISDAPEFVRVAGRRTDAAGSHGLIAEQARRLVDPAGVEPSELEGALGRYDEEGGRQRQAVETGEVDIAAVHDVEGAGFRDQLVEHPDVVPAAVADMNEARDIAPQIQQGMQFDGGLRAHEGRPWKDREAEVDGGRIEGVDGLVEIDAEAVLGVEAPGDGDQGLGEVGVDAPVALVVGVGQGVSGDTPANAHVIELGALRPQAGLDVAQALAVGQLGEGHAEILIEAGKALDLVVAAIAFDTTAEAMKRQLIDELCEDELARVHEPSSSPWPCEHGREENSASSR